MFNNTTTASPFAAELAKLKAATSNIAKVNDQPNQLPSTVPAIPDSTLPASQSKNDAFSQGIYSGLSKFSSLFPKSNVKDTGAISNTTPKIVGNLDPSMSKLGAMTTNWGESTRYEKFHPGIDIANKIGTPIPAFVQGKVTAVDTGHKQGDKAYGNTITVTDQWGNKHRYSHLNQVFVKVGQQVGKGQEVATMGNTGQTYSTSGKGTGSHLDYRIVDAYQRYINPFTYLAKNT